MCISTNIHGAMIPLRTVSPLAPTLLVNSENTGGAQSTTALPIGQQTWEPVDVGSRLLLFQMTQEQVY